MGTKVLLLVADSLRADSFERHSLPLIQYKRVKTAFPYTIGASFALMHGRHFTHVYWPNEVNVKETLTKAGLETKYDDVYLATWEYLLLAAKLLEKESPVCLLRENGVKTYTLSNAAAKVDDVCTRPLWTRPYNVEGGPKEIPIRILRKLLQETLISVRNYVCERLYGKGEDAVKRRDYVEIVIASLLPGFLKSILYAEVNNKRHHLDVVGKASLKALRSLKDEVFVYFHALTPHYPYTCYTNLLKELASSTLQKRTKVRLAGFYMIMFGKIVGFDMLDDMKKFLKFFEAGNDLERLLESHDLVKDLRKAYEDCVRLFVEFVKEVSEELVPEGWNVIVTSDHPEYFGEGGLLSHPHPPGPFSPHDVPLGIMGDKVEDLKDIRVQTQIPELFVSYFGIEWESPSREEVYVSIPYWRPKGGGIAVSASKGNKYLHMVSDGKETLWLGSEDKDLKELILQHLERARKERRRNLLKIRTRLALMKR